MMKQHSDGFGVTAISNPLSGKNKNNGYQVFSQQLDQYPEIKHISASTPEGISQAISDCESRQDKVIIVNGGDGTLQCVLTDLKKEKFQHYQPELLLLGSGTTSMTYGDVGCNKPLNVILKSLRAYGEGKKNTFNKSPREVLRMAIDDTRQVCCGMFFGAGTIYDGILYCRKSIHSKGLRGELGASLGMFRFLFDWLTVKRLTKSVSANICVDSNRRDNGEFNVIVATTLNRLLAGVFPFWSKCLQPNQFVITLVKHDPPRPVINFLRILRGHAPKSNSRESHYQSYAPYQVELDIEGGFTLDGELFGEPGKISKVHMDSAGKVTFLTL